MWTSKFWKDAAERALKTAGQFGAGAWAAATFTVVGDVVPVAQATGLAMLAGGVLSLLTSIGSAKIGDRGSASLVD